MTRSTSGADRCVPARLAALVLTVVLGAALLGCEPADQPPAEEEPGAAFLAGVPPVVEQGIEIAALAEPRTERPEVVELAERTVERGTEELRRLEALRAEVGLPPPDAAAADPDAVADAGLSEQEVTDLARLDGEVFDLAFADALAEAHRSVIREATAVPEATQPEDVAQLAAEMREWREADVAQLERWRDEWEAGGG